MAAPRLECASRIEGCSLANGNMGVQTDTLMLFRFLLQLQMKVWQIIIYNYYIIPNQYNVLIQVIHIQKVNVNIHAV